jgi:hypothetical protein
MFIGPKMRAARARPGIDHKPLAEGSGLSVPTLQPMLASTANARGALDSRTKVASALASAGVRSIGEGFPSTAGGHGVGLNPPPRKH